MTIDLSESLLDESLRGPFGRPFRLFQETDSTNERALEWLQDGAPEGAVVVADHQTAGRGRRGRSWESRPGTALLFSIVLRPRGPAEVVELLTTTLGVACAAALERVCSVTVGLKWPNDVMVDDRKLGGILVESRVTGGAMDGAVAGIGINVRWPSLAEGSEFPTPATSITAVASDKDSVVVPQRPDLLAAVLEGFEGLYERLADLEAREEVRRAAAARSTVLGHEVAVRFADGSSFEGRAHEVTSSGALVVERAGSQVILGAGEIEKIRRT